MSLLLTPPAIRAATSGPKHHFFGYYDKSPWDPSGRWLLALEVPFSDRPPVAGERAVIGVIDTEDNYGWTPLTETRAWNWQQSCMLQWVGEGAMGEVIFNDLRDGRFMSRIYNIHSGRERVLERPIYGLNRAGTQAISLNFSRLHHQRPGYGYAGVPDPWEGVGEPEDDGLYAVDLRTGRTSLILSVAEAAGFQRQAVFDGKIHRFNHVQFSSNNRRFAFLHRYKSPELGERGVGDTRLLTVNIDGSELHCLSDHEVVSHYDWRGEEGILAWALRRGTGKRYYFFPDSANGSAPRQVNGQIPACDGHCSFSPDGRWVLTDTYPDETHHRTLILYNWQSGERCDIGRFHSPPVEWQIRCDLHPRWSRDGTQICIDSVHEGSRQIYVLDVSDIVSSR